MTTPGLPIGRMPAPRFARWAVGGALAALACCGEVPSGGRDSGALPIDARTVIQDDAPPPPVAPYDGCRPGDPEAKLVEELAPPPTMKGGDKATVSLAFANCGAVTWIAAEPQAERGHKLGFAAPRDATHWGLGRVALPDDVPPDHRVRVRFEVTAPESSGDYGFSWAIVDEWVRWLDEPSAAHSVTVEGTTPTYDFHPRTEWQTAEQPVSSSCKMDLTRLQYITLHYNGVNIDLDGPDDVYQDADYPPILRAEQRYYLNKSDPYSLGYNSMIAPDGDEWEVRGFTYCCAANGCSKNNLQSYAIQIPLPYPEATPTPDQVQGVRQLVARIRAKAKAAGNSDFLELNGHRDVAPICGGATACPGDIISGMIARGELEP